MVKPLDGEMSITQNLFNTVTKLWPAKMYPGMWILEIGSGVGTAHWVKAGYRVATIEHDEKWLNSCAGANYLHAPLENAYYREEVVREHLKNNYDMWIIDGPPGIISDRTKIIQLMDELEDSDFPKVVIVDDCQPQRKPADGLAIAEYIFIRFRGCPMFEVQNTKYGGSPHSARVLLPN